VAREDLPLPEPLSGILDVIQYYLWEGEQDNPGLVAELIEAIKHLPETEIAPQPEGAVRLATPGSLRSTSQRSAEKICMSGS